MRRSGRWLRAGAAAIALLGACAAPARAETATFTAGWLTLGGGWRTPYYIRTAATPGPVVVITGGVHGDEPAGAGAADTIRHWEITKGTLVVIPEAAPQALAAGTRTIPGEGDLNRNFPGQGDAINDTTGPTAAAIWSFVREHNPDWLLDMHEGYDYRASNPASVGSSIIHMNDRVTNAFVDRMIAAVNADITDPGKLFVSLGQSGPVDTSLARASVTYLGTRGMILETTSQGQPLSLRVDQHRTMASQFLQDQQMITGPFGGDRGPLLDDFTFDEPPGMTLPNVGNSLPGGGSWGGSPLGSQVNDGRFRIQRNAGGTASTTTGQLGGGTVRVRRAAEPNNTPTDITEGFATMIVSGWDFRGTEIGETISLGFRSTLSPSVFDTAQLVLRRTGLDEVSLFGEGFGSGSGGIAGEPLFRASRDEPVQFVLQLNKQENLDGSALVSGAAEGGFYRIYYQTPGRAFVEIGSGAAVRQARNGNHLNLQISGPVGSDGGYFDIDRVMYSSAFPEPLFGNPSDDTVVLFAPSGTRTQGELGHPLLTGAEPVEKTGAGRVVLDAANTHTGSTTILTGTLEVASSQAVARSPITVAAGGTLAAAPGLAIVSPAVTLAGGTLAADGLAVIPSFGIGSLTVEAGSIQGSPTVTIMSGGLMTLSADSRVTLAVGGLSVAEGTGGGLLDLGAGAVTIAPGGTSLAAVRADILAGRNGGGWDGQSGITSTAAATGSPGSRAVGYAAAPDGSVTVSFAAPGDTDLDGEVTLFDLVAITESATYQTGLASDWSRGDFNYDGLSNVFDLIELAAAGVYDQGSYLSSAGAASGSIAVVPEPALWPIGCIGLAGLSLLLRGRRG